ncbi:MAG: UDP-N-acetyl-D-mannosamine dehydrogenase [Planctomycetota bacterium]|nr:UDP-N-acetyl-D-mannosamine dehydrogenase [Planctomycetota bacterium]MDA1180198.1 UDP-N-acetyl-D-mannosamine dehydrogenase [Planctomycetota bacterium]
MTENSTNPFEPRYAPGKTTVCVMGLGYIGLPTASVLATKGFQVHGVDVRPDVVDTINQGKIHIEEPDLDILVRSAVNSGQLKAGKTPQPADIFMICVPTPIRPDRSPDLSYVKQAGQALKPYIKPGNLVILESTSPPRTTEDIVLQEAIPANLTVGRDVFVAHCPERVLPGRILFEVVQNDRVVGGITPECTARAKQFYESFVKGEVLATNALAAEVTKLVENSYRDVNIAFANELSILADRLGIDAWEVIELANRHPRVNILTPGPGVGGHCISVDPWFLVHAAPDITPLMRTAREVNNSKPHYLVEHIERLARPFASPVIGCLGIAYKADVDDIRESPSLEIVQMLAERNVGQILVCDPFVPHSKFSELPLLPLGEVLERSQILVLLTDHRPFREIPRRFLQEKVVVDTRGAWR